jgi:hypothetical protein
MDDFGWSIQAKNVYLWTSREVKRTRKEKNDMVDGNVDMQHHHHLSKPHREK